MGMVNETPKAATDWLADEWLKRLLLEEAMPVVYHQRLYGCAPPPAEAVEFVWLLLALSPVTAARFWDALVCEVRDDYRIFGDDAAADAADNAADTEGPPTDVALVRLAAEQPAAYREAWHVATARTLGWGAAWLEFYLRRTELGQRLLAQRPPVSSLG